MTWNATKIARVMVTSFLKGKFLQIVPNCYWPGHECDLLLVTPELMLVDVEIKISRADFKADAKKEKWWHRPNNWRFNHLHDGPPAPDTRLLWPPKVWRHYYVMPTDIWKDGMEDWAPSEKSGILTVREWGTEHYTLESRRRATSNKGADPITYTELVDVVLRTQHRLWDAHNTIESLEQQLAATRGKTWASKNSN